MLDKNIASLFADSRSIEKNQKRVLIHFLLSNSNQDYAICFFLLTPAISDGENVVVTPPDLDLWLSRDKMRVR